MNSIRLIQKCWHLKYLTFSISFLKKEIQLTLQNKNALWIHSYSIVQLKEMPLIKPKTSLYSKNSKDFDFLWTVENKFRSSRSINRTPLGNLRKFFGLHDTYSTVIMYCLWTKSPFPKKVRIKGLKNSTPNVFSKMKAKSGVHIFIVFREMIVPKWKEF